MTLQVIIPISIGLIAVLGGATWYLTPKQFDVIKAKNLQWSKYCEKQIILELDFHDRFNNIYTPAQIESSESNTDIYGGVRKLGSHYVEERERLLSLRGEILQVAKSIFRIRCWQIGNLIFYVFVIILLICLHPSGSSKWWLYLIVWVAPWFILFSLSIKQSILLRDFCNE